MDSKRSIATKPFKVYIVIEKMVLDGDETAFHEVVYGSMYDLVSDGPFTFCVLNGSLAI